MYNTMIYFYTDKLQNTIQVHVVLKLYVLNVQEIESTHTHTEIMIHSRASFSILHISLK